MSDRHRVVRKKIGELLIEGNIITREQLEEALALQRENKRLLGEILIDLGYATEEDVMKCLTAQYGLPYLPLDSYEVDSAIINLVPPDLVHKYNFVPIDKMGNLLIIVTSDVISGDILDEIGRNLKCNVQNFVTTPSALRRVIEKYYK